MIDWKKYVDHIYIVNYTLTNKYYLEHFYKELNKVNINRNDIDFVTDFQNIDTPFWKSIYDKLMTSRNFEYGYQFSCSMGHYYCMKHAQNNNYENILILENDAVFFDNIETIVYLLDNVKYLIDNDKCDLFLGGSGCIDFNGKEIDYNSVGVYNCGGLNSFIAGTTFNLYNKRGYNTYINLIENGTYYIIDMYDKIYNIEKLWICNPLICVQKEWDLCMYNLYAHYDMPKPIDESIMRAINTAKTIKWTDNRNLYKITNNVLEHFDLVDKYKDIYEEYKKYY